MLLSSSSPSGEVNPRAFRVTYSATDPANNEVVIQAELLQLRGIWFPTMEHIVSWVDTCTFCWAEHLRWEVPSGKDRHEFPELSSGHTSFGSSATLRTPTRLQNFTQVAEICLCIKHEPLMMIVYCHGGRRTDPADHRVHHITIFAYRFYVESNVTTTNSAMLWLLKAEVGMLPTNVNTTFLCVINILNTCMIKIGTIVDT